jgi:hypothetical protein
VPPADEPKPVLICAWCGRWKDPQDPTHWHPAETLTVDSSAVSHGMCPDCRHKLSGGVRKGSSHRRGPDTPGTGEGG